jgi:hypothetical protein
MMGIPPQEGIARGWGYALSERIPPPSVLAPPEGVIPLLSSFSPNPNQKGRVTPELTAIIWGLEVLLAI